MSALIDLDWLDVTLPSLSEVIILRRYSLSLSLSSSCFLKVTKDHHTSKSIPSIGWPRVELSGLFISIYVVVLHHQICLRHSPVTLETMLLPPSSAFFQVTEFSPSMPAYVTAALC